MIVLKNSQMNLQMQLLLSNSLLKHRILYFNACGSCGLDVISNFCHFCFQLRLFLLVGSIKIQFSVTMRHPVTPGLIHTTPPCFLPHSLQWENSPPL